MFNISHYLRNMDKDSPSYLDGRLSMQQDFSITNCPQIGTDWDKANWLAGWLDALAETALETKRLTIDT